MEWAKAKSTASAFLRSSRSRLPSLLLVFKFSLCTSTSPRESIQESLAEMWDPSKTLCLALSLTLQSPTLESTSSSSYRHLPSRVSHLQSDTPFSLMALVNHQTGSNFSPTSFVTPTTTSQDLSRNPRRSDMRTDWLLSLEREEEREKSPLNLMLTLRLRNQLSTTSEMISIVTTYFCFY